MSATTHDSILPKIAQAMMDLTLSQGFALLAVIFVVNSIATSFGSRRRQLDKIPTFGHGSIPIGFIQRWYATFNLMANPNEYFDEGYRKYKGSLYRVCTLGSEIVVVAGPDKLTELLAAPDHVISSHAAANEILQTKYTVGPVMAAVSYHAPIVRINLTQHIGRYVGAIKEEIANSFNEEIGSPLEWTEVPIADIIPKTIAKLGQRVMFGTELARNEEYIDHCIAYTTDLITSLFMVKACPSWLKGLVAYWTPSRRRRRTIEKIAGPFVQKRIDAVARGDEVPDDMLTWLIQGFPEDLRTVDAMMQTMMFVNFGSIHSTASTFTTALYAIAAEPDKYIPALRQEFQEVFDNGVDGEVTKQMLGKLVKTDSILLESTRLHSSQLASIQRAVLQPFTFKDGTTIPAGTTICLAGGSIQRDPEYFDNPEEFDGFRFARQEDGQRVHTVNTSVKNSTFGHGRHACPGRFFAVNEMKLLMAELLIKYDVRLIPGTKPKKIQFGLVSLPEVKLRVLIRARKGVGN